MKKTNFLALLLIFAMMISSFGQALAADVNELAMANNQGSLDVVTLGSTTEIEIPDSKLPDNIAAIIAGFEDMTLEELNAFIDGIIESSTSDNGVMRAPAPTYAELQLLWLAGAAALRVAGYPCAATLLEHSVVGVPFVETNGVFATPIKATTVYKNWAKNPITTSVAFARSANIDLFLSLHLANICIASSGSSGARVLVTDVYDFALTSYTDSVFISVVNNAAYLCQQIHVLTPISVSIYFDA